MKGLQRVWQDFQQGENIDLYVTVAVSMVLVVLGLINIVPESWILPLNLAVLALLSIAILGNRYRTETVLKKIDTQGTPFLTRIPQEELSQDIEKSKNVIVLGQNLGFTMRVHYPLFREKLRRGDTVQILLVDPDSPVCEMAVKRNPEPTTVEDQQSLIRQSLRMCDQLIRETSGELEVRLIDWLPSFGAVVVDPELSRGAIYRWNYSYNTHIVNQPQMVLRPEDGHWYELFREEIYAMWEGATRWEFP
jgi:hypothetical protein